MGRDWPAKDMVALDRPHRRSPPPRRRPTTPTGFRRSRRGPFSICASQRLTALGRDEIAEELEKLGNEIERLSRHPALARSRVQHHQGRARGASRTSFATPRRTEIVEQEFEVEDEDLIQREDMVVTVSHAGYIKRVPLVRLSRAAPRRQGPRRHADARGGFRHQALRRQHPHAGPVLLLRRHGLPR